MKDEKLNMDFQSEKKAEKVLEQAYENAALMSILAENLMYCKDIGSALYAVSTGDEKALLRILSPD